MLTSLKAGADNRHDSVRPRDEILVLDMLSCLANALAPLRSTNAVLVNLAVSYLVGIAIV